MRTFSPDFLRGAGGGLRISYFLLFAFIMNYSSFMIDFPKLSQSFLLRNSSVEDQVNLLKDITSFELLLSEEQSNRLHKTTSTTKMAGRIRTRSCH